MKRTLSLLFLGLAVMLGLSMAAFAQTDTIYFNGSYTGSASDGYGTGYYGGTLNGTSTQFICDDFPDHIVSGESWTATVTNLGNLSGVLFQNPNGQTTLAAYTEVAWLAGQMASASSSTQQDISWAIWTILDSPGAGDSNAATWVTAAETWYNTCMAGGGTTAQCTVQNINIYTPVAGSESDTAEGNPQEFIGEGTGTITITPEPLNMALMGTFLTLAGLGLGKKKQLFS
jgi:hypothetical protein